MRRSSRLAAVIGGNKPAAVSSKPAAAPPKRSAATKAPRSPTVRAAVGKRPKKAATPKAEAQTHGQEGGATSRREEAAWARGVQICVGCDEAGRGPLAGPVVAAACALPSAAPRIAGVSDSKTIVDEAAREALYAQIVATPGVVWSVRVVSAARIDEINILMASLEAMRLSIVDVLQQPSWVRGHMLKPRPSHAELGRGAVADECSPFPYTRRQASPSKALALVDGPFSPWKEGEKYPSPPPSLLDPPADLAPSLATRR